MKLRDKVMKIMSEPRAPIAGLSEADRRALPDILARAVDRLRAQTP